MSLLDSFKLQKLKILAFLNVPRDDLNPEKLEVMFNPESVRRRYNNNYHGVPASSISKAVEYSHSKPSSVSMKLVFDDTGVDDYLPFILRNKLTGKHKSVPDRVNEFVKLTVPKGEIHQPPHLIIEWGKTLDFNCRLVSLDVNYTIFTRDGTPLRAELNVEFVGDDMLVAEAKKLDLQSPDLTHYRVVKSDDQLPLMCEEIYGSSQYYLLVAKANGLDDFRNLKPGQEIYFPPIEQ